MTHIAITITVPSSSRPADRLKIHRLSKPVRELKARADEYVFVGRAPPLSSVVLPPSCCFMIHLKPESEKLELPVPPGPTSSLYWQQSFDEHPLSFHFLDNANGDQFSRQKIPRWKKTTSRITPPKKKKFLTPLFLNRQGDAGQSRPNYISLHWDG